MTATVEQQTEQTEPFVIRRRRRRRLARALIALLLIAATVVTGLVVRRHEQIVNADPLGQGAGSQYGGLTPIDDSYGPGEELVVPARAGTTESYDQSELVIADHPVTILAADLGGLTYPPTTVSFRAQDRGLGRDVTKEPDLRLPYTARPGETLSLVLTFAPPHCTPVKIGSSQDAGGESTLYAAHVRLGYRGETLDRQLPLLIHVVYPVNDAVTCVVP